MEWREVSSLSTISQEVTRTVDLTDVIAPAFYDLHWDIVDGKHTYYVLGGGRGSTKSTFAAVEILLGMIQDPNANAIIYRKVADTIKDSTYEQILWAMDKLKMKDKWHCTTSPYRCIYKPTGQKIVFKGLDKAVKQKSAKVSRGYFKYLWFEEYDEYAGEEEIRSVQQSIMRGGPKFVVFKTYNPPRSLSNWVNEEVSIERPGRVVHKSDYTTVDPTWLGQEFIEAAEYLKATNEKAYRHEYLGEPVGTGANVFDNIIVRPITDEEIKKFDWIYRGIDWGWYPDPYHYGEMYYDSVQRILYIFKEYRTNKTSNLDTWTYIHETLKVDYDDLITADSAEEKSVSDYRSYGSNCRGAEKGPQSVKSGIKWLQSLTAIVIDGTRCPHTREEFVKYELEKTKEGKLMSSYPDANNHSIDMTRYAMERVWKRRGN